MSRLPYRGGPPDDYGYDGRGGGRGGPPPLDNRWDTDRFATERGGRARFDSIDRSDRGGFFEERDSRVTTRGGGGRVRERSVDEVYERRGSRVGDDRYERRHYHDDDGPRMEREPSNPFSQRDRDPWDRRNGNVTIDRDDYGPQRRTPRPGFLRRQSSLDTFDRKPLARFVEREEYGPPARYRPDDRAPPMVPIPLPRTRQLGPPPRQYDDVRVAEPDFYGDEEFRAIPERVREREVVRRRRRSRSRDSIKSRSRRGTSVRSDSVSSSSSSDRGTVRSEFPKRGKTRMPARLVSKKAIIDLGYPFEEEGDTIIIMRALGRENIDEVIKLSEDYKDRERVVETEETTYVVGGSSTGSSAPATTVVQERQEFYSIPPPAPVPVPAPAPVFVAPPPPPPPPAPVQEIITDTKVVEHFDSGHHHHHHGGAPIIVNAPHPSSHYGGHHDHVTELREVQTIERVDDRMALAPVTSASRSEAAIRAEIRALELEKESLRRDRRRRGKSVGHADLVVYDEERFRTDTEEVTVVRKEKIIEPDGGVRIEKDRKAKPPPRAIRAMLKTLT